MFKMFKLALVSLGLVLVIGMATLSVLMVMLASWVGKDVGIVESGIMFLPIICPMAIILFLAMMGTWLVWRI